MGYPRSVDEPDERWRIEHCATYLGIAPGTWRYYYANRFPRDNPAPLPDGWFGRTPWWWPERVREWNATRPGRGWRRAGAPAGPRARG